MGVSKGNEMTTTREEVHRLVDSLPEEGLDEARDFLRVLLEEPAELSEEDWEEVRKGEGEFKRGEWVRWEDVRRADV